MASSGATYTNYSLLCRAPSEDDKLYYWENFQRILPVLDPVMVRCATTKVISWQHFNKIKWRARDQSNVASSSDAPTGGSTNRWCRHDLEKIFTLYLNDRTYHRYIFSGGAGPLPAPPVNPRGYPFHYMTAVLGNSAPLKPDASIDWYNREADFRFQIPYYFGQFPDINMMLELSVRDGWMSPAEMDGLARTLMGLCHGRALHRRTAIAAPAFVHTFERTRSDRPDDSALWTEIR